MKFVFFFDSNNLTLLLIRSFVRFAIHCFALFSKHTWSLCICIRACMYHWTDWEIYTRLHFQEISVGWMVAASVTAYAFISFHSVQWIFNSYSKSHSDCEDLRILPMQYYSVYVLLFRYIFHYFNYIFGLCCGWCCAFNWICEAPQKTLWFFSFAVLFGCMFKIN